MHERIALAPTTGRCRPWCTDHYTDPHHPEDGYCRQRGSGEFADVYLSDDLDGRPMILSYEQVRDELTPAYARAFARLLNELADAAEGVAA